MLIRVIGFVLRILGHLVRQLCRVLVALYDVTIVLPLLVERFVKAARGGADEDAREARPVKRAA
jgi:transposase